MVTGLTGTWSVGWTRSEVPGGALPVSDGGEGWGGHETATAGTHDAGAFSVEDDAAVIFAELAQPRRGETRREPDAAGANTRANSIDAPTAAR